MRKVKKYLHSFLFKFKLWQELWLRRQNYISLLLLHLPIFVLLITFHNHVIAKWLYLIRHVNIHGSGFVRAGTSWKILVGILVQTNMKQLSGLWFHLYPLLIQRYIEGKILRQLKAILLLKSIKLYLEHILSLKSIYSACSSV